MDLELPVLDLEVWNRREDNEHVSEIAADRVAVICPQVLGPNDMDVVVSYMAFLQFIVNKEIKVSASVPLTR